LYHRRITVVVDGDAATMRAIARELAHKRLINRACLMVRRGEAIDRSVQGAKRRI